MNKSSKTHVLNTIVTTLLLANVNYSVGENQSWAYTYNANGQILSANGPRTDVDDRSTHNYDLAGNRISTSNALGHTVRMENHNSRGQARRIINANGISTTLTYHPRGWLLSSTVDGDTPTTYTYDPEGQLLSTTLPNGTVRYNEYDQAHRLIAISNNLGERVEYTLDPAGNHVQEITKSASDDITKSQTHIYDELNRLIQITGATGQITTFAYDTNSNKTATTDGNQHSQYQGYDALDRLTETNASLGHNVGYLNDTQGNVVQITDPSGLITSYNYDGYNNLVLLDSPDTGITSYSYDAANNKISQTDANGVTTHFSYDALNRLESILYPNSDLNISYGYDEGVYGKGHLTSIIDANGTTLLDYDKRGNIVFRGTEVEGASYAVSYAYNSSDQLIQLIYPSGRIVDYTRGVRGYITGVSTTTSEGNKVLASNIGYQPFGPMDVLEYGNGIQMNSSFDLDYRLSRLNHTAIRDTQYSYDNADNITGLADNLGNTSQFFAYDALNRLGAASGTYGSLSYTYDENGNRLTYTNNTDTDTYLYDASSHRLLGTNEWDYQYDSNGNQIAKITTVDSTGDGFLYRYDDNNRLVEVLKRSATEQEDKSLATYHYNASGQRVRKTTPVGTLHYVYGTDGMLLAEVDEAGITQREYFYLNGQPLGAMHSATTQGPPRVGDTLVMDDGDPGTSSTGSWGDVKKKGAYNDYYSRSNNTGNTYRFTPDKLNHSEYELYAWWPKTKKNNKNATYTISHNGKTSTSVQNQATLGKRWVLIGTYQFSGDGNEYIELSDLGGKTAADGIRLVELVVPTPVTTNTLYYAHNDHLGTPQVFTDQQQHKVWSANYKPFGETAVSINTITNNLRFPGQYFDEESGLHQNYFRDYDPGLGRYVQSDPIGGLAGTNSYMYASANPVFYIDKNGLITVAQANAIGGAIGGGVVGAINGATSGAAAGSLVPGLGTAWGALIGALTGGIQGAAVGAFAAAASAELGFGGASLVSAVSMGPVIGVGSLVGEALASLLPPPGSQLAGGSIGGALGGIQGGAPNIISAGLGGLIGGVITVIICNGNSECRAELYNEKQACDQ